MSGRSSSDATTMHAPRPPLPPGLQMHRVVVVVLLCCLCRVWLAVSGRPKRTRDSLRTTTNNMSLPYFYLYRTTRLDSTRLESLSSLSLCVLHILNLPSGTQVREIVRELGISLPRYFARLSSAFCVSRRMKGERRSCNDTTRELDRTIVATSHTNRYPRLHYPTPLSPSNPLTANLSCLSAFFMPGQNCMQTVRAKRNSKSRSSSGIIGIVHVFWISAKLETAKATCNSIVVDVVGMLKHFLVSYANYAFYQLIF